MRLLFSTLLALGALPASAATIAVTSAADGVAVDGNCTLREAVLAANTNVGVDACAAGSPGGDTVLLTAIAGQTVTLRAGVQIDVTESVAIGAALQDGVQPVTVVGDGASRLFRVDVPGGMVSFGGLVLRGGRGFTGGAVLVRDNTSTLFRDVTFEQNASAASGGALRVGPGEHVLTACTFTGNETTAGGASDGGGALYNDGGTLTLNRGTFSDNRAAAGEASGGALLNGAGAATAVSGTLFERNRAARAGGAIETSGALTVSGGTFQSNEAGANGGAVHVTGAVTAAFSAATLFVGNVAQGEGGALWNSATGTLRVRDSALNSNTARGANQGGGAIYSDGGPTDLTNVLIIGNAATGAAGSGGGILTRGPLTVDGGQVVDNTAVRAGGGIEVAAATGVVVSGVEVRGNTAGSNPGFGGGLHVTGAGTATVERSTVESNVAAEGGGLWNSGAGTLTVRFSTLHANLSTGAGGGLFQSAGTAGATRVENSLLRQNEAATDGGGIGASGGRVVVENATLSSNQAARGGGIAATGGEVRVESATIEINVATASGGGVFNAGAADRVALENTIVSDNLGGGILLLDGALTSRGHNLFRRADGATITRAAGAGPDLVGVDPLLLPLADNGGPTETHAPGAASPAIGAGRTVLTIDQRGFTRARPQTIGAFEANAIVAADEAPAAGALGLSAAVPNPARSRTVLRASAPDGEALEVVLLDALGRRVETLYAGTPAGPVEVAVDASGLPPGVYVVRMASATARATRRVTVVR